MEQKQPHLCVVFSLIDCSGPRLLGARWILSEYLLECWEDKNHNPRHHTTEAGKYKQTERQRKPTQTDKGERGRKDATYDALAARVAASILLLFCD